MVFFQSSKISLSSSPPQTTSILLEPNSLSLALIHSDSSISLYPSLSFYSLSSLPPKPQTLIPPPSSSSSSSFVLLQHDSDFIVVFLLACPHRGGSQILIRMFIWQKNNFFTKSQVVCNQKGLGFDPKLGVLMDVNHGVSIKIAGSINYFAMYSVSSRKVWVFALKLIGEGDAMKLMICAVIECCMPVWSISVSFGFLILGEDNGVRVFNLRQLVKGNARKIKSSNSNGNLDWNGKLEGKGSRLPNGVIWGDHQSLSFLDGKIDKHFVSVKQKSVRCRQDSGEGSAYFLAFKSNEVDSSKSTAKAVSIQALSSQKFVILDSTGDLHILSLSTLVGGASLRSHMMHLPHSMEVQELAILPDISSRVQAFWISDGFHSVHVMAASEVDIPVNKNGDEIQEKLMQISVIQAIFAGEKILDFVPLAGNAILILGQANIYTYAIP